MFKRNDVWWTCIRHNGKKIQKSLETADRKLAQAIESKIRTEIVEGSFFEKPIGSNKTFRDMMDKFTKEHAPTVSIRMQESYATSLKHLDPFFGSSNLLPITPKMINKYKVLRRAEGAAPGSINTELAMLSKAFSLAVMEWEWLKDSPVSRVPREKEDNEIDRWLNNEEVERLLGNSPEWLREIISFALNTGLRQDELLSLEWNRVNLFRKTILIQKTKNGKPKTLPLNEVALDVETEIKYSGYIKRHLREIDRLAHNDSRKIRPDFNYKLLSGLSMEAREKLSVIRPETLGQALRVSGITHSDLSVILVHLS